jgi:hypothetical protein
VEAEEEHTKTIDQIVGHLKMIDTCVSALEGGVIDVGEVQEREKKSGGTLQGGPNNYPILKVSHCWTLHETPC